MPEGRTHTALSGSRSRLSRSRLSSAFGILSGGPSGSSSVFSGCFFFHASELQLPLLKNLPTITTLYRRAFWAIRTQSILVSGAKLFHRLTVSLWTAPSWEMMRGTITALDAFFSLVSCVAHTLYFFILFFECVVHFVG